MVGLMVPMASFNNTVTVIVESLSAARLRPISAPGNMAPATASDIPFSARRREILGAFIGDNCWCRFVDGCQILRIQMLPGIGQALPHILFFQFNLLVLL